MGNILQGCALVRVSIKHHVLLVVGVSGGSLGAGRAGEVVLGLGHQDNSEVGPPGLLGNGVRRPRAVARSVCPRCVVACWDGFQAALASAHPAGGRRRKLRWSSELGRGHSSGSVVSSETCSSDKATPLGGSAVAAAAAGSGDVVDVDITGPGSRVCRVHLAIEFSQHRGDLVTNSFLIATEGWFVFSK